MGKYTRRQFITSAGVGMAAVAGLGLAGCAPQTPADKAMANTGNGGTTFADTIAWDGEYDVVVIGFGGAGAVSACYAADAGAKVLLIDKAPQGMEGGNTRFCGQIILNSDDKEAMLAYNKAMAGDFAVDDELMDAYAEGLTQTKTMLRDFFGVPEENFLDWKEDSSAQPMIAMFVPEYPELEGGDALHVLTVSDNVCNSALWKTYRNKVMSMSDNIDVWYMSPATKLFQDPVSRAVIGVEIDKAGETVNIRAKNGVVMTMGGFENNKQMVEDFLGLTKSTPAGTLFNTGDGVKMAMGVGADLWHMEAYEGNCFALGGISFVVNEDQHAKTFNDLRNLSGSVIVVGNGGERYLREDVYNRHGHVPSNGDWVNVKRPRNTYMVWDAAQNEAIAEYHGIPAGFEDQVVSAATIAELEAALGIPAGKLEQTVTDFNKMANDGYDPAFFRAAETMRAFGEGPFYAIEMIQAFLNTQGGARRNARAEVVGTDGEPIPHLYSAGEFGGMTPYQYNGGGNMAECLIFGQLPAWRGGREGSAAGAPHGRGLRDRLYPGQRQPRGRSRSGRFRKARRERVSRHLHPVHGQRACREGEDGGRQDRRHRHRAAAGDRRCGQLGSRGPAGPDHRGPVHRGRRRCRRYRFLHGPEGRREQRTRPGEVARLMR